MIAGVLAAACLASVAVWAGFGSVIGRYLADPRVRKAFNWSMAGLLALSLIPVFDRDPDRHKKKTGGIRKGSFKRSGPRRASMEPNPKRGRPWSTKKLHSSSARCWATSAAPRAFAMVRIGDALGLYRALQAAGPMTCSELRARDAGVHERYLREWLSHQAASGYLAYDPAAGDVRAAARAGHGVRRSRTAPST